MLKQVAIVILNWNGKHHLERFLPSVVEHSSDARIIVADNASTDDSLEFLSANHPQIEIVRNAENGGFARGYNEALAQIESEFFLLLNSDVQVTKGWLDPLVKAMDDPQVAACQPKVLSVNNPHQFEHAGAAGGFLDVNYFPFCRGRIFELTEKDKNQYDGPMEIFWATGACLLIRSTCFLNENGFDEDFFAHMEEIDLCWRLKRKGKKIMVAPASTVYHLGGGTLPYSSPTKTYLNFRNSLFMLTKNHPGWLFPKLLWRLTIDGMAAGLFLAKGEFRQFKAVFNAHMSFSRKLGTFLRKRKAGKISKDLYNPSGLFTGNILWNRFGKGVTEFSKLNQRLFK